MSRYQFDKVVLVKCYVLVYSSSSFSSFLFLFFSFLFSSFLGVGGAGEGGGALPDG